MSQNINTIAHVQSTRQRCHRNGDSTTHTLSKRGGVAVEYQGRKRPKTTNVLYLTDRQGLPLMAMSKPMAGNHNDLSDIEM
ncbi:MAG: hypothetical protein CMH48_10585 [Muricauda sp.]|nr:hypothetical protein [Allomuricauda sp.]MBC31279.1 hypothetical protein [Allomuricauda sp.]